MMIMQYIQNDYPNIGTMLEEMPHTLASMAIYFLATLPDNQLRDIEAMLPDLIEGLENKDQDGTRLLLLAFGIPDETVTEIFTMLPAFIDQSAPV